MINDSCPVASASKTFVPLSPQDNGRAAYTATFKCVLAPLSLEPLTELPKFGNTPRPTYQTKDISTTQSTPEQMADKGTPAPADLSVNNGSKPATSPASSYFDMTGSSRALRQTLKTADGGTIATPSESASEEDYDDESRKSVAVLLRRKKGQEHSPSLPRSGSNLKISATSSGVATPSEASSEAGHVDDVSALKGAKVYTVASDDKELRDILRRGMQRVSIVVAMVRSRLRE